MSSLFGQKNLQFGIMLIEIILIAHIDVRERGCIDRRNDGLVANSPYHLHLNLQATRAVYFSYAGIATDDTFYVRKN